MSSEDLGYRRLEWTCTVSNTRSRSAADRLGFVFEGILRQAEFCSHRWLDHAVFGLLSTDLPHV